MRGRMGKTVKTKTSAADKHNKSISSGDLEALQVSTQALQEQLSFLQEQQGQLEQEINQLQQQLRQSDNELKRIQLDTQSLRQNLPHQEEHLRAQKIRMDETKADPVRVAELEAIKAEKTQLFEASQAKAKKVTAKVEKAQDEIREITGERVSLLQKAIDELVKQIAKLTKHTSKLSVEITTSVRNVTKSTAKIESLQAEVKAAEETISAGVESRNEVDADSVEINKRIKTVTAELAAAQTDSSDSKKQIVALEKQEAEGQIKRLEFENELQLLVKKVSDVQVQIPHWQNKLRPLKLNKIPTDSDVAVEPAAEEELASRTTLKTYTEEQLASYKLQDLQYKISVQEEKLKKKPNLSVIEEYFEKRKAYMDRVSFLEEITQRRNEMRQLLDDVRKKRYNEFMQGFNIITKKLKEMYQMITQGGDAELELVDSLDPFSEGVSFSVRPPKKSWKNISNLSGGEKTLSSLALVFALHYYKPSPMYFMDEIDAALDFRNVSIVANYIKVVRLFYNVLNVVYPFLSLLLKARTRNAQFIIISLRSNMFELSDYLTGIYKITDYTRSITIRNRQPDQDDVHVHRVPDTQNPNPPNTQSIFDQLQRQNNFDDTQCLNATLDDQTASQVPQDEQEHSEIVDVTIPESPDVSVLMDVAES